MRRCTMLFTTVIVAFGAACIDMSAPGGGPASISLLQAPAAFVVAGDVMRDSAGNPAGLSVIAYDGSGTPIPDIQPLFFVTDSSAAAHIVGGNQLVGDTLGVVHVVGQVGSLQTGVLAIPVTVEPTTLVATAVDTLVAPLSGDTAVHGTESIPFTVTGSSGAAVQGVIVHVSLIDTLPSTDPAHPSAYLVDDQANMSGIDTTDAGGAGARTLVVVAARIPQGTPMPTTIRVQATATYRGTQLAGSPAITTVPVITRLTR
jgi:hypothetical protein